MQTLMQKPRAEYGGTLISLKVDTRRFEHGMRKARFAIVKFQWMVWCGRQKWPKGAWFVSPPLMPPNGSASLASP